jgi:predicted O-methyltransferase YrrM
MKSPDLHRLLATLRRPWLRPRFEVPTHLTSREKVTLMALARDRSRAATGGARVLEIGSYLGASTGFLAAGLQSPDDRVLCVDTWANDAMTEGKRDTMAAFLANTAHSAGRIVPIRGWSTDPAVMARAAELAPRLDLLFIDGDHSYEGALADWRAYSPLLAPGAIVAMHDIGWAEGVERVVAEEIRPRVRRERRLPNLWWGQLAP